MTTLQTASPVNIDKMKKQCKRLYDFLMKGNTIHCFHPARRELKIGYLNSRVSDLVNKNNVTIHKQTISVKDSDGEPTTVKEYSAYPFDMPVEEKQEAVRIYLSNNAA